MLRSLQMEKRRPLELWQGVGALLRGCAQTAAMFLLMYAELPPGMAPLAPALLAACLGAGEGAGACVLGCALGMLRLPLENSRLLPAFSCVLVLALQLLCPLLDKIRLPDSSLRTPFIAGVGALLPPMIAGAGAALPSLKALACGALAAAATPYLHALLRLNPECKRLSDDEKTGLTLLLGACLAGLNRLFAPAGEFFAALWVLCTARSMPLCGVTAGLALWLGGGSAVHTGCLALCGAVCASPVLRHGWQRSLALCGAAAALQLAAGPAAPDARWVLCAAAAYPLLPEAALRRLEKLLSAREAQTCDPSLIARELHGDVNRRLNALADAFCAMAEPDALPPDVPDEQELIQRMRARLCAGCIQYGACWAGESNRAVRLLCHLIGQALERTDAPPGMRILFSDGEIPPDVLRICRRGRMIPDRLGLLLRDFAEKRRSEIKRCETNQLLSLHLTQAADILRGLARQDGAASGRAWECVNDAGVELLGAVELQGGALALVKGARWLPEEARRACIALEQGLRVRYRPQMNGAALHLQPLPRLQAEAASSCQSGLPGQTSGDSHLIRMLDGRRLMLAISDGMGTGEAAHGESQLALRLLRSFLEAGISPSLALETLNQQLLARCGDELFSTLDLCIIDLNSGIAELTKLAACRTILLRGGEMLRIDGGCLPLGIVEHVQPEIHRVRLRPGDLLVMGSDGVMEAGETLLVERALQESAALPPDQLAEHLVRLARLQGESTRSDDLTCICARIARAE